MDSTLLGVLIGTLSSALGAFITVRIAVRQLRENQESAAKTAKENQESANRAAKERQNDLIRNQYDDLISERRAIVFAGLNDPFTCAWILKRFNITAKDEEHRMYVLGLLQVDHYEHVFYRYWHGLFPEELWPQWQKSMFNTFPSPEFIKIMESRFRYTLSDGFWAYYSLMCPEKIKPHDPRFDSNDKKVQDLSREKLPPWPIIPESI